MSRVKLALFSILLAFLSGILLPYSGLINQAVEYFRASQPCTFANRIRSANLDKSMGNCPAGDGADVIELTENITLTELLPSIRSEITILGNGHTISGDGQYQIIEVTAGGNLTLKDAHLTEGFGTERPAPLIEHAGAIEIANGRAAIINCTITESTSEFGGAVDVASGVIDGMPKNHLTIIASTIRNNRSFLSPISIGRGALVTIQHSNISENGAGLQGGAINNSGQLRISDSVFRNNSASDGGAIANFGELTVLDSIFVGNSAVSGAAIYSTNTFSRDSAHHGVRDIYWNNYSLDIHAVSFTENSAYGRGGGLYIEGGSLHVSESNIERNNASGGGGLYAENAVVDINTSAIHDNRAQVGGGIFRRGGAVMLRDTIVDSNSGGNLVVYERAGVVGDE